MEERIVHSTRVKIDLIGLQKTVEELRLAYLNSDPEETRATNETRSKFSQWNNINHFLKRMMSGEIPSECHVNTGFAIIKIVGSVKGSSARVYYKPSITSLAKPVRKHIVPIKEDNVFVYFDLKAAEFFMNCVFCGEQKTIQAYQQGDDVYLYYRNLFPNNTPRAAIKEALIANMYGMKAWTLSKRLNAAGIDCTETLAQRMLDNIEINLPSMTTNKIRVIGNARRKNAYFCPNGFDTQDLVKISEVDPKKGFLPLLALSTYVQSALGNWMQEVISKLVPRTSGTIITVFDSVTAEIALHNVDRYKKFIESQISPFRTDGFKLGKTFFDAQEGVNK